MDIGWTLDTWSLDRHQSSISSDEWGGEIFSKIIFTLLFMPSRGMAWSVRLGSVGISSAIIVSGPESSEGDQYILSGPANWLESQSIRTLISWKIKHQAKHKAALTHSPPITETPGSWSEKSQSSFSADFSLQSDSRTSLTSPALQPEHVCGLWLIERERRKEKGEL